MWTVYPLQAYGLLLAQVDLLSWELSLPFGALFAVLILGAWAIVRLKYWREETEQCAPAAPNELLDQYDKMVADGLLEPEEFARIKDQLARETQAKNEETDDPSSPEPPEPPAPSKE